MGGLRLWGLRLRVEMGSGEGWLLALRLAVAELLAVEEVLVEEAAEEVEGVQELPQEVEWLVVVVVVVAD